MKTKKKEKRSWKNDKNSSQSPISSADSEELKDIDSDLTDYAGDCIKLMSEVFKILGDKKLKQMMPSLLKPITIEDLKASLVEESMALSKKRIVSILNGTTYSSSSSDTEEELIVPKQEVDVVSLDGITDDSDVFCWDDYSDEAGSNNKNNDKSTKKKHTKKMKKIKANTNETLPIKVEKSIQDEKAITALELLELQARARAIKSQLALESTMACVNNDSDEEVVKAEPSVKPDLEKEKNDLPSNSINVPKIAAPAPKKVKLRRNHLRLDPNRTTGTSKYTEIKEPEIITPNVETMKLEEPEVAVPEKKRRNSNDSIILESPPRSLIVISSEDEGESKNKKKTETHISNSPIHNPNSPSQNESSCEEGEVVDEPKAQPSPTSKSTKDNIDESSPKLNSEVTKSLLDAPDPDCIVIDSEPEFDTDPEEEGNETESEPKKDSGNSENLTDTDVNATWKVRWLDSKKVQNVLQTSKLFNNVKRKYSLRRDLVDNSEVTSKVEEENMVANLPEGTVEQFNALTKKNDESETTK